ncbi:unnamed protein product [Rhizophagus irregularis]|nr:unnamed protein product [Rhizophagus irregularis]
MQVFLTTPKYNKFYIYKTPTTPYQRFCNAFGYHRMVNTRNPAYPKISLCIECNNAWKEFRHKSKEDIEILQSPIEEIIIADSTPPPNAAAQKKAAETINATNMKLAKLQQIYNSTNDLEIRNNLLERMATLKQTLHDEDNKIKKLKRHAGYQRKCRAKKIKHLQEHQEVIQYDSPGRPSFLIQYPNLHEHIHECIEFGAADKKRRKEVIKVRTIRHLRENLNSKYNEYLSRTTLNNYLLPSRSNTKAAKTHHHPALIANASVSRTEKNEHIDEHYCLASVKGAKQFAALFSTHSVIISQDDKAKVPLGIPAVGRTFQTIQSFQEPVTLPDHDFPVGMQQKLIPSVYLLINPSDTNDTFCNGQLSIFVRPQYHILLVDGGPDKNPRHMKNIFQYCKMFCNFDLDYLSVRTHAPGQSAYNPVERSMSTLSQKLAGITLPIDKFGFHLNSQGQVTDLELAMKNFRYAAVPWQWIENHTKICQYSLDIKKCEDSSCCSPKRHEEAAVLLAENDGFLPPVTKRKDGHFLNLLHILEYCDKLKIPGNDAHCPSINADTYERLCCSECDAYFPTLSMVAQHKKIQHPK